MLYYLCCANNFNREFYDKPKELELELGQVVKDRNMERKSATLTLTTHKNYARQPQCGIVFMTVMY